MMRSYRHSDLVQGILKDARFIGRLADDSYECNGHGMAYTGNKALYKSASAAFIVHTRAYRGYLPPQDRVLSLPASVDPADYEAYEADHEREYSPWQDMIADESV